VKQIPDLLSDTLLSPEIQQELRNPTPVPLHFTLIENSDVFT
jgi:hypothetical protein